MGSRLRGAGSHSAVRADCVRLREPVRRGIASSRQLSRRARSRKGGSRGGLHARDRARFLRHRRKGQPSRAACASSSSSS